jgi:hypothetical protein
VSDYDAFKRKAFDMLDVMSASGLDDVGIGLMLAGMSVAALVEGGKTRDEIHLLIDAALDDHKPRRTK